MLLMSVVHGLHLLAAWSHSLLEICLLVQFPLNNPIPHHCDVKPDNWVLMASNSACDEVSDKASIIDGSDLMLVDFGQEIDLTSMGKDQTEDVWH